MAYNAGASEYLVNFFAPKDLFSRIRAVIGHPRSFIKIANYIGPDRRRWHVSWDDCDNN